VFPTSGKPEETAASIKKSLLQWLTIAVLKLRGFTSEESKPLSL
jgi:hypothetical protein